MNKVILFLLLSLPGVLSGGSCCAFDLGYIPEAMDLPDEEEILACMSRDKTCDSLFFYTRRMISAGQNHDQEGLSRNFELVLPFITSEDKNLPLLKIVYLYATFLEREGEAEASKAYYKYIENNTNIEHPINLLAKIGAIGIEGNTQEIDRIKSVVLNRIQSDLYNSDETLSILTRISNYLNKRDGYYFSINPTIYSIHSQEDLNPKLHYLYLTKVVPYLAHEEEDKRYIRSFSQAEKLYSSITNEHFYESFSSLKAMVLTANGEYKEALKIKEELLFLSLGQKKTVAEILKDPPHYNLNTYRSIHGYATTNLFQTRLGAGLKPVFESFDLFELFYKQKLNHRFASVHGITAEKSFYIPTYEMNLIIAGGYLYQNTNDPSYLSRAVSIVDGNIGAGNSYWTVARNEARENKKFWDDISAQKEASGILTATNENEDLSTLFLREKKLRMDRERFEGNYPDFFEKLHNSYNLDFKKMSDTWCREDSSGIVAFYLAGNAHYRITVTADTIDFFDIYPQHERISELTAQLKSVADPKTGKDANAEASRELYALLFAGIDSLLPPNLHIVATGELEEVPFPALRREAAGEAARYLGAEIAISRQVSINSMRLMREQEMNPRYLRPLGMAPSFANESLQAANLRQAGFVLPPLLYSTDEVKDLEARGPGSYFYGARANLPNYLRHVSDYSIVHLATHAISSEIDGLRSRIYLASEDGAPAELYASDIGDQALNADLVVLSACETGTGGRHATEGRISLTRAYLAAGARSVVSSNWAVDDFATAAMMKTFYAHIQDGKPPHRALQLSRAAYLEQYPDAPPYKWAAFEAHGGMRPVRWDRSRSRWPMLGYGALAAAGLGLGAVHLRRRRRRDAA